MKLCITCHEPDEAHDWSTLDFEEVEEAFDELEAVIEAHPAVLTLAILCAFPPDVSMPEIARRVIHVLMSTAYEGGVRLVAPSERVRGHFTRYLPAALRPRVSHRFGALGLLLTVGDLSEARADAIVNASNARLELGGGVSHALNRRFGPTLQQAMRAAAPSEPLHGGDAVVTLHPEETGVRAIYHVVSNIGEEAFIQRGLHAVVTLARDHAHAHVILPALGAGTGGLPLHTFALLLREVCEAHASNPLLLELWCWTEADLNAVSKIFSAPPV